MDAAPAGLHKHNKTCKRKVPKFPAADLLDVRTGKVVSVIEWEPPLILVGNVGEYTYWWRECDFRNVSPRSKTSEDAQDQSNSSLSGGSL